MRNGLRALVLVGLALTACTNDVLPGYRLATFEERASILAVVEEYYGILGTALVTGDVSPLHARHPKLAEGEQRESGINSEAFTTLLPGQSGPPVRDAKFDVAGYEPFRAFVLDDHAVGYAHGIFTWTFGDGTDTKGEFLTRFDLTRDGARWSIDMTDDWVLGEAPPPTPR